jgi:hypothetical protein
MHYFFTTLAVNEPYFSNSLKFYADLHERTEFAYFNITTTEEDLLKIYEYTGLTKEDYVTKYSRIKITTIEQINPYFKTPLHASVNKVGFSFHLNYKALSIKACVQDSREFDYVIFTDGDWLMHEHFSEEKILNMFSVMETGDIDFAYERPAKIGNYKQNGLSDCFFIQKVRDYNVVEHSVWDEADVINEQIFVIKNNWKLKFFSMKWEQFLWYSIANDINSYPDGFDIGVSALESKMKMSFSPLAAITECFYFYGRYNPNERNVRF